MLILFFLVWLPLSPRKFPLSSLGLAEAWYFSNVSLRDQVTTAAVSGVTEEEEGRDGVREKAVVMKDRGVGEIPGC
jgi:hypothetical protein